MSNFFKNFWNKIVNKKNDPGLENFRNNFENQINNIEKKIETQKELNLLHSGHTADIVNTLPVIKELSKKHKCNLFIGIDKPLKKYYPRHPAGDVFLNNKIYDMLEPLLKKQSYINKVKKFNNEKIDINFDIIREIPINLLFDNTKYSFVVTGMQPNLALPYIESDYHDKLIKKVVIQRSFRYRNPFINYKFLNEYENLLFVGTKEEFDDMNLDVKKLEFYDCKDFLEMSSIIKSSKFVIGNSSLAFPIAEGLKVPRLLEACPHFPAAQPHGENAFDFYFQIHFEKWFKYLYYLK